VRLTVPVAARGDVEVLTAVGASPDRSAGVVGFYGGQYRRLLGRRRTDGGQAFLTFGGIGVFAHTPGYTTVSPPLLGIVGGGFEQRVSRRLSLRVDGQAIVLLFIPVGVRLAGGIAVPIGSATR
jgi:hypothetical protein